MGNPDCHLFAVAEWEWVSEGILHLQKEYIQFR